MKTTPFARWSDEKRGDVLPRTEAKRILSGARSKGHPYVVVRSGKHRFLVSHGGRVTLLIATDGHAV